jgi:hypothetical protein
MQSGTQDVQGRLPSAVVLGLCTHGATNGWVMLVLKRWPSVSVYPPLALVFAICRGRQMGRVSFWLTRKHFVAPLKWSRRVRQMREERIKVSALHSIKGFIHLVSQATVLFKTIWVMVACLLPTLSLLFTHKASAFERNPIPLQTMNSPGFIGTVLHPFFFDIPTLNLGDTSDYSPSSRSALINLGYIGLNQNPIFRTDFD